MSAEQAIGHLYKSLNYELACAIRRSVAIVEKKSESPIETLFVTAFYLMFELGSIGRKEEALIFSFGAAPEAQISGIQQYEWRNHRIDFAIFCHGEPIAFVECDGHEFHERTKEQAERDRSRDREIQTAGILALRFTGREIWRDPFGCANNAWEAFFSSIKGKKS